jgi:hypothetical protein
MLDFEKIIERVVQQSPRRLVAIDGLPLAGKSTLADRLALELGTECVRLDDFVKPEAEWRSHDQPSFPFDFIRYDEFVAAVSGLATSGLCFDPLVLRPAALNVRPEKFGWIGLSSSKAYLRCTPTWPPCTACAFGSKATLHRPSRRPASGECEWPWAREWRELFLPSVDIYLQTKPWERADILARGRGR